MDELITIEAKLVNQNDKSYFLDCEGDYRYFPKSLVEFNEDKEELKAPLWLLKEKFPDTKW